jgi:hypothetical protein
MDLWEKRDDVSWLELFAPSSNHEVHQAVMGHP